MRSKLMPSILTAAGLLAFSVVPAIAQHSGGHSGGGHRGGAHAGAAAGHASSRPNAGHAVTGHAVPRTNVARHLHRRSPIVLPSIRSHIGVRGLAFGMGPYGYDGRSRYGYGYPRYISSAYGYGRGSHARLRIVDAPRHARVYVDGYYAGVVDKFDGVFEHLELTPGPHQIEIVAAGFATVVFDVHAQGGRTLTYRTRMVPYRP